MALLMVAAAVWTAGWTAIILLSPPSPFPSLPPRELALHVLCVHSSCARPYQCAQQIDRGGAERWHPRPPICSRTSPKRPHYRYLPVRPATDASFDANARA
ncbi:hypothetical protein EV121DRAFT_297973 [Schizophyllum commune]